MPAFAAPANLGFDVPPFRLSGSIYGVLMNHRAALEALGGAVDQPPYKGAPKGVVLYVKPRNTLVAPGEPLWTDAAGEEREIGAALGIVIGRTACAVAEAEAMQHVAGFTIAIDASVPHDAWFRPSVRFRARDASLALGPRVVARTAIADPDALRVRVFVDGRLVHEAGTGGTIRTVARLVADVSDFMTLSPGDVLLAGVAPGAPRVGTTAGIAVEIDRLGRLETRLAVEPAVVA
jgi:5-oxopent-3-ene-1,2,5-tricarboxylate decarboxylase/2-hydroxyhepta-2,4-diene-1,7-dioate isomerase